MPFRLPWQPDRTSRRRATVAADAEEYRAQTARLRLQERQLKYDLTQGLIAAAQSNPELLPTVLQLVYGQQVPLARGGLGVTKPAGASSDPFDQLERVLDLTDRLEERSGKRSRRSETPEGVNPTLHALMNSPLGEKLGETAAPLLAAVAQQVVAKQHGQAPPPLPQLPSPVAAPLPPAAPPPPDPAALLAALAATPVDRAGEIALLIVQWAPHYGLVQALVDVLVAQDDEALVAELKRYNRVPGGWGKLTQWLCGHDAMRRAIALAVRERAAAAASGEPAPAPPPLPQLEPQLLPNPQAALPAPTPGLF